MQRCIYFCLGTCTHWLLHLLHLVITGLDAILLSCQFFVTWTKQGVWNIPQRFGPYWCDSITQCRLVWFPSMMQIYYSTTFQRFSVGLFDCCTDRPVNWQLCLFAANAPIAENIFEDNLQIKFNYINKKQKKVIWALIHAGNYDAHLHYSASIEYNVRITIEWEECLLCYVFWAEIQFETFFLVSWHNSFALDTFTCVMFSCNWSK